MHIRTIALSLAIAGLAASAEAQTTSPATTASSNGKDASAVHTTPPQDPTLGSGQTAKRAKRKPMKVHHRVTSGGSSSSMSPGGPGSPPPVLPNATGSNPGT